MEPVRPVLPDYGGAWVGGIVPALLGAADPSWLPAEVEGAGAVVLLVVDGLGWSALTGATGEHVPTLRGLAGGPITTVVPSTTGAALTSISTAVAPAAHGIVGYRMRVGGEMLTVLSWQTASGKGPDPRSVQPHEPFLGRSLPVVTRSDFRGGGFSNAHLRGSRFAGWSTTAVLVEQCRLLVAAGERFVYAYYDGVDKVAHEFGLHGSFYRAELASVDRLVADLLAALPPDCTLLVTSDHGQVHVDERGKVRLGAVAALVTAYGGEGRFRSLHARTGAAADLRAAAGEAYGSQAWVLSRDELLDEGWLGTGASAAVRGRIGDVVLAAREPVAFIAPDFKIEARMLSFHGSVTAEEMLVPLVAGRGLGGRRG
jgi:hypothetical protein